MTDSTDGGDLLQNTAEAIGHALGRAAGVVDTTRTRGEELVAEAGERLAEGQAQVAEAVKETKARAEDAVKRVRQTAQQAATRVTALKKSAAKVAAKARSSASRQVAQAARQVRAARKKVLPQNTADPETGLLIGEEGKIGVVFVRPAADALNLAGSGGMLERIKAIVASTKPEDAGVRIPPPGYTGSIPTAISVANVIRCPASLRPTPRWRRLIASSNTSAGTAFGRACEKC